MADIDVGSPRKAARVIVVVVFALSFINLSYVADRLLWHSSLESIRIRRDIISFLRLS